MPSLTEATLIECFGRRSSIFAQAISLLCELSSNREPDVQGAYERWRTTFHLTARTLRAGELRDALPRQAYHDVPSGLSLEQFLFCLQTYYVAIVKLMVARLFVGSDPETLESLGSTDGQQILFRSPEFDYFDWPRATSCRRWRRQEHLIASTLVKATGALESGGVATDIFKGFYQHLIPPSLRKTLGEFYTPEWIVRLILDEIEYDGTGRLLDPSCGSGVFLFHALERLLSKQAGKNPNSTLQMATESVFGFDINPVAVATAKANYLLALKPCWANVSDPASVLAALRLPVFLADSAIATRKTGSESVALVMTPAGAIEVPESVAPDLALGRVIKRYSDQIPDSFGGDVWKELLKTFITPVFAGQFDYVVGNPPWVAPSRMPEDYRKTLQNGLLGSGFLEPYRPKFTGAVGEYPGAESQFVAALPIVAASFSRFLRPGGKLAFLLTSSLLKSLNGGGFRKELLARKLVKIIDLSLFTKVHAGASSWAFIPIVRQESESSHGIFGYDLFVPSDVPLRNEKGRLFETSDTRFYSVSWRTSKKALLLEPSNPRSPWFTAPPKITSIYRTLLQDRSRLGDLYRINRGIVSGIDRLYFFHKASTGKTGKLVDLERVSRNGIAESEVSVEAELVYPLLKGETCDSWRFEYMFAIIPHLPPMWNAIDVEEFERRYSSAHAHFRRHKRELLSRRTRIIAHRIKHGSPFYVMEMKKELGTGWKVAFREIASRLEACVVPPLITDSLLGSKPPVLDHTVNFLSVDDEDTAHLLCALLNSLPLRTLLYDIAIPKGGRPMKRFDTWAVASLPAPAFDKGSDQCNRLITLSRQAHSTTNSHEVQRLEGEIDTIIGQLLGLSDTELGLLRRHYGLLSYVKE